MSEQTAIISETTKVIATETVHAYRPQTVVKVEVQSARLGTFCKWMDVDSFSPLDMERANILMAISELMLEVQNWFAPPRVDAVSETMMQIQAALAANRQKEGGQQ